MKNDIMLSEPINNPSEFVKGQHLVLDYGRILNILDRPATIILIYNLQKLARQQSDLEPPTTSTDLFKDLTEFFIFTKGLEKIIANYYLKVPTKEFNFIKEMQIRSITGLEKTRLGRYKFFQS